MHRRGVMMAAATASAPPAFSYDDIPSQLLRINSLEGSLTGSGGVLTGVTDVSGAGETVTVTGSPVYTAADAGLNGAPSFTPGVGATVIATGINRASVAFVACVVYRASTVGSLYAWDGDDAAGRHYLYLSNILSTHRGTFAAPLAQPVGRKRLIVPFDGSTPTTLNGTSIGTMSVNNATGSGLIIGERYTDADGMSPAFYMACSSVPSAPLLTSLEAKLLEDFG